MLLNVYAEHVPPTTALLDVLPVDVRYVGCFIQRLIQIRRWMAVISVGNEVDVVPRNGVFYGIDRLSFDKFSILGVLGLLQVS